MNITIIWTISIIISLVFLVATQTVQKNLNASNNNWSQFECGFNLITPTHLPFSFQFFLVALLFLIFDVEISAILSYPLETNITNNNVILIIFLILLTIGLLYEWQKSKLDWSN